MAMMKMSVFQIGALKKKSLCCETTVEQNASQLGIQGFGRV